ncbi:ribbon-helix-helix domain-containing protein [Pseudomonas putida]|uniref:ribbon-helix-helix domain-containing protein n=1 Tax=Pseudomonas putida TaxID=303 RepID=UPI000CD40CB1|nr:ribbon-helix-helix domain-containing protein [Pseudomonas putida]POG16950.1 hypothetical protein BGP85_27735 [Pseudomonas putida]
MAKKPAVSLTALTESAAPSAEEVGETVTLERGNVKTLKRLKHTSLYLPPEAQRAIKEIAFQFDRRPHDLYIEGINMMLAKYGKPPVKK